MDLNAQFRDCHLRYRNFCKSANWREFFAETDLPERPDLLADLMAVDMGKLVLYMIEMDPTREKFVFLPYRPRDRVLPSARCSHNLKASPNA